MAAYAALLSLMNTIKQIQHHPRPPISLDKKQVDSLTESLTFLQDFLERYSSSGSKEEEELESRIADAAYTAEDVIESYIVDQIHAGSTSHGEIISSIDFYRGLQKVIQDMDLIRKEVNEITKEKMGMQDQLNRYSSISAGSVRPASVAQNNSMVDFGDILDGVMEKLIGQQYNLQIIPIVGMGGIGKTTLARNIYANPLIVQHFDILAWVTISQEYSRREILQVLCQETKVCMDGFSKMSEDELGETLYKYLWGRRYLVVMDDIWSIEAWDKVRFSFPDDNNGSKIMITTRQSNLAFQLSGSYDFKMNFLDEDKSWNLLCKIVFGKEGCPIELEKIGKKIASSCRGLPLSIVVIGGVLTKSKMTREYWKYTLGNLNSIVNLENNKHCLHILNMSYKELPIHLKPCFLYMAVFPEDYEIRISQLINLWVAEGFVKSIDGKSLEVVAEEYFMELIDRNLILVHQLGWNRKLKLCKIHDLLRDLCLRETKKQRFLFVLRQQDLKIPQGINMERRICICKDTEKKEYSPQILHALESTLLTRSLFLMRCFRLPSPSFSSRLLRLYSRVENPNLNTTSFSEEAIFQQANLRYLCKNTNFDSFFRFPSSFSLLWNLQTLVVVGFWKHVIAPSAIWKMSQLRHVMFSTLELPDPSSQEDIILENLQTLSYIYNFKCSEEVVKRIPNIMTLKLYYKCLEEKPLPNYYSSNLGHLQKLESLALYLDLDVTSDLQEISQSHVLQNLSFPHSLKKLTLWGINLHSADLTTKIGSLPFLEVLKLKWLSYGGAEWKTVEGQFCSLKFLLIEGGFCLKYWTTEGTHFPRLEHLVLLHLLFLEEIPSSIGDIPTLQSIQLEYCIKSAIDSAKRIKQEQEELGNVGLEVWVVSNEEDQIVTDEEEDQIVSNEEED